MYRFQNCHNNENKVDDLTLAPTLGLGAGTLRLTPTSPASHPGKCLVTLKPRVCCLKGHSGYIPTTK